LSESQVNYMVFCLVVHSESWENRDLHLKTKKNCDSQFIHNDEALIQIYLWRP